MTKFSKEEKDINDKLHKWLSFINNPNDEVVDKMALIDNEINKALDILSFISSDKEVQKLAEAREKAITDEISRINGAREDGIKHGINLGITEGLKQGMKNEKINIAKNLLDILDDETIALKTGLTIEEISKLR